jgi:hypothetical protein
MINIEIINLNNLKYSLNLKEVVQSAVTTLNEVVVISSNPPSLLLCEHAKKKKI